MATSVDYIEFVCEQIKGIGNIRYKKMFGEYMVYVNDKPVILVCDNTVFVKQLVSISGIMSDALKGYPYDGAKEHYILDIENIQLCQTVIPIIELETSLPKSKKDKREHKLSGKA